MRALLIRRRRPVGEPDQAAPGPLGVTLIDGTAGAGRIAAALIEAGIDLSGVRQAAMDPEAPAMELDSIDLRERFEVVALGSHLVNLPDRDRRSAFLRLAARHAAAGAPVLVEHHPIDWTETAAEVPAVPGGSVGMVDVRADPPFVTAVSVYDVGGRVVRQPFTARVLSDADLGAELAAVGLSLTRRLTPTWVEARSEERREPSA